MVAHGNKWYGYTLHLVLSVLIPNLQRENWLQVSAMAKSCLFCLFFGLWPSQRLVDGCPWQQVVWLHFTLSTECFDTQFAKGKLVAGLCDGKKLFILPFFWPLAIAETSGWLPMATSGM